MAGYGIIRVDKIKACDKGVLVGRLKHAFREFPYQNEKTKNNEIFCDDFDLWKKHWQNVMTLYDTIDETITKRRPDSVSCFEVVITSSQVEGWTENDYRQYLKKGIEFTKRQFRQEPMAYAIHWDEKVPHVHLFYSTFEKVEAKKKQTKEERENGTQRTEKVCQYNAKRFFGGKEKMRQFQDSFYEEVCREFKFERGEVSDESHRTHQRITLENEIKRYKTLSRGLEEQISDVKKRSAELETEYAAKFDTLKMSSERLSSFMDTVHKAKNYKNEVNLADILHDLTDEERKKCWKQLKNYADNLRKTRKSGNEETKNSVKSKGRT